MYDRYGEEVEFLMVYIREAHPTDGRPSRATEVQGILFTQPDSLDERAEICLEMCEKLDISIPAVLDSMNDTTGRAYNAAPDRLYLVGRDGRIAYQGDRGPRGFDPSELELAIKAELKRSR